MPVVDGEVGRAFDLRDRAVDADDVSEAIRGDSAALSVECPTPGPVHRRVGVLEAGRSYPIRTALAQVARQRGHAASVDDELATVREELAAIEPPAVELAPRRRQVAETEDAAELQERVATLRGQLTAARERGEDPEALAEARERAVADLAERRTERLAAEQSLERARSAARDARDRREERLRLQDRERNLQRDARRELAAAMNPSFHRALEAIPGGATVGDAPGTVDGPDVDGALAVCRLARLHAPVIVATERFATATVAAAALDSPVVLVVPTP